jgi:hypothetical protein
MQIIAADQVMKRGSCRASKPAREAAGIDRAEHEAFHRLRKTLGSLAHERSAKTLGSWRTSSDMRTQRSQRHRAGTGPAPSHPRQTVIPDGVRSDSAQERLVPRDGQHTTHRLPQLGTP